MENHSSDDARRSLETIGASRQEIAGRMTRPRWYYPVMGVLMAQLVLVYGLYEELRMLSLVLWLIGAFWLPRLYVARTGVVGRFPATLRSGLVWTLFLLGLLIPMGVTVLRDDLSVGVVVVLALTSLISTIVIGQTLDVAYRADVCRDKELP